MNDPDGACAAVWHAACMQAWRMCHGSVMGAVRVHRGHSCIRYLRDGVIHELQRRQGGAAAARATRIADGLPLEDAGGEEDSERTAGLRRPYLSDAQLQAARIENCLHQKRSVHRSARVLQDSKPAGSKSACKPACSSPGCCSGCAV